MSESIPGPHRVGIILVAGGSGQRLGYGMPKAQVPLAGEMLLAHALRGVDASGVASHISVAVPAGDAALRALCTAMRLGCPITVVDGGATRSDSVRAALNVLPEDLHAVLVHDAARALAPAQVFHRVASALAAGAEAVIPAVPVVDTVKSVAPTDGGEAALAPFRVTGTPDRSSLRAVQTPQGFDAGLLRRAHAAAADFDEQQAAAITDDAMLAESLGATVHVVEGSDMSLKITTPLDLLLAEAVLSKGTSMQED
ncbi:2-C-methyl-D-erythritol 4-phosphate cytidylyltransferase [Arthrobacter sp. Sa2BUA2]|uniref:2-C-methyl-D-erythritol 4-phosphate cytidylyltransferase n=1 Tax=Arthrobacter pullicola TaxID=2762224 RepID=A0ABR8YKE7_9MICC|nr:2-C-methyl-D-erythritol 4-phosphate cytidylyltransferase [Arthrobacter pullicola]MBD8044692.1 2-C-methyl-D-erythritol 4-phosphate cytidylyltransferase [Arthrobacter pullicola]